MEIYVVCFDISDDRIRTRIGKRLLRYGDRVQKSVFEIAVRDERELNALKKELKTLAAEETDIRFYRLCASCRRASHGLDGAEVARFPAVILL